MKKISALHQFLQNLNLVEANKIDSWIDGLEIVPSNREQETGVRVICEQHYTANFFIEDFPHKRQPPELLFAQISAWRIENDFDNTKSFKFPVLADLEDCDIANIEFSLEFVENVLIVKDSGGQIWLNGETFALAA